MGRVLFAPNDLSWRLVAVAFSSRAASFATQVQFCINIFAPYTKTNSFVVRIHSPNNHVAIIHLIGMWDAEYHATGCCADGSGGGRRGSGADRFGIECRSEESRVGKACVGVCRYRWSTDH